MSLFAMSLLQVLCSPAVHLLSFAGLFGTQLYQSFIVTKVCYTSLPSDAFIRLQRRIFPIYFRMQSVLWLVTALSFPPTGPWSLVQGGAADWASFAIGGLCAVLNLLLFGPNTMRAMLARRELGMAVRGNEENGETDVDLAAAKRRFSKNHAASIHLNLLCIIALSWHGWRLAGRMAF
ncbi:putative mitochondrial outer membrane protein-like protein [Emericellopsis cladophorae]|uniref:Mitochondrial outer membrane protein-like protein n=1 Tax=Emericellopsis cladophorae TaxID=2686198 RepID=A0A9P9Y6W9_9HYPO|nr:putative mitochondrial outer membrane protein-like protein [Emericellopsis cladophorae]KAI6784586.1 putative mitochondrial outer membrane protein-like protein [Emericellopsis cladophorae]